ncbi:hypothetical protein [Photobacterium damselae]|uniref:Phage protein n=2 Tax=Photobacterium damselae TaxID=38293 RepID=A0A2T3QGR1_PHODM|nr:hypothetical protein [Photobacterium damselae]EEZ41012.1 putative phage protein [Photobacterium damselae subsp. damselae CIP 102761]PSW83585.1 hypothetical protein CTN07_16310 [Photobacterium damselae]SPY28291.1 Uncharacterised protein [Photobacterium damselae]
MKKIVFQQLSLISDLEKSANIFQFSQKKNLILGSKNNVGKTCLSTSIFWALGIDLKQPKSWKDLGVRTVIKFTVGCDTYHISRKEKSFVIHYPNYNKSYFDSLKSFSIAFANIINFKACIKEKSASSPTVPYTAIQLICSYIHQDTGWSELFKSFNLYYYHKNEISKAIDYFVGLKPDEYFKPQLEELPITREITKLTQKIDNISFTKEAISVFNKDNTELFNPFENYKHIKENKQLNALLYNETEIKELLLIQKKERFALKEEIKIIESACTELFKDYQFATNNIEDQIIQCPTCGTEHENNVVARFNIIDDRDKLITCKTNALNQLYILNEEIDNNKRRLNLIKNEILMFERFHNLPSLIEDKLLNDNINIFDNAIKLTFDKIIASSKLEIDTLKTKKESIKKFSNNKEQKERYKNIVNEFNDKLLTNFKKLNIEDAQVLYDKKIIYSFDVSGSDISRSILSYYKTLNDMMKEHCSVYSLPFVIDTPYQQEQDNINIDYINNFLNDWDEQQLLIFGVNNKNYQSLIDNKDSNVIMLTNKKSLLSVDMYNKITQEFNIYF